MTQVFVSDCREILKLCIELWMSHLLKQPPYRCHNGWFSFQNWHIEPVIDRHCVSVSLWVKWQSNEKTLCRYGSCFDLLISLWPAKTTPTPDQTVGTGRRNGKPPTRFGRHIVIYSKAVGSPLCWSSILRYALLASARRTRQWQVFHQ
jgi:hypothetical protein